MKGERLFRILGLVDDDLIDEAEDWVIQNPKRHGAGLKWAVAACVVMAVCGSMWQLMMSESGPLRPGSNSSNDGGMGPMADAGGSMPNEKGTEFMHYAGPILPLDMTGNSEGITADRSILLDFTADTEDMVQVTDEYLLSNSSDEDKTLELIYPFVSSINDSKMLMPQMSAEDYGNEPGVLIGGFAGGFTGVYEDTGDRTHNLKLFSSWQDYRNLLSSGQYLRNAYLPSEFEDLQVTVYSFSNVVIPDGYDAATLAIEFYLPEGSEVMTSGINGLDSDDETGYRRYSYFASGSRKDMSHSIIILGTPPDEYKVAGYENGSCEKEIDGFAYKIEAEVMKLSDVIKKGIGEYQEIYGRSCDISPLITADDMFRQVISMFDYTVLGSEPKDRYQWMMLEDIISEAFSMNRVMYLTKEVTIAANSSLAVKSSFVKSGSYDFGGAGSSENMGVTGYDMVTKLGSGLTFTGQKASVLLPEHCEIVGQNFGFDPESGITEVELDLNEERYYIDIRKVEKQ